MKKIILILIVTATFSIKADPLTDDQIKSFNIENLNSKSFDTRMNTFRIIEVMDWKDKYRDEIEKAILKMLKSTDIMQKRTGIQGENLLHMDNPDIYEAIVRNVQTSEYKKGNQNQYFRTALFEYFTYELEKSRKKLILCK